MKGRAAGVANLRDARRVVGMDHGRRKLDEGQVREIRRLRSTGLPQQGIADAFGISQTQVGNILRRKHWAHLSP